MNTENYSIPATKTLFHSPLLSRLPVALFQTWNNCYKSLLCFKQLFVHFTCSNFVPFQTKTYNILSKHHFHLLGEKVPLSALVSNLFLRIWWLLYRKFHFPTFKILPDWDAVNTKCSSLNPFWFQCVSLHYTCSTNLFTSFLKNALQTLKWCFFFPFTKLPQ